MLRYVVLGVFLLSFLSLTLTVYFKLTETKVLDSKVYYSRIEISDIYGIDVNSTALIFGAIIPGAISRRGIDINNTYSFPINVEISPHGDIMMFVRYLQVHVGPMEYKHIEIEARAPRDIPYGKYEGSIELTVSKARS